MGAEKLVPLAIVTPSTSPSPVSNASGIASGTSSPGAVMSTAAFSLEKYEDSRLMSSAATDSTCGKAAGYDTGLPSSNSLPAAATTMLPEAYARAIAAYST